MLSVRAFAREKEYPIALFLTYAFDPLFFERIPLADLSVGGSRRIVVLADAGQARDAIGRCIGQLAHLGRRYVLAETANTNLFHPKLIARLSEKGGRVWLASGNLTYGGWGANGELATSWSIGPDEDDKGAWLDEVLSAAAGFTRSTSFADQLRAVREEIPWLTQRNGTPAKAPVLLGTPARPLGRQLAERWGARRFDELLLCTGSTDTNGAFLSWANRQFGVRRATVCLSPAYASFNSSKIEALPLTTRVIVAPPEKYMHAKFYWFSGPDGSAAVIGSANCSAAAWFAGNVELVVPYDDAKEADFATVLAVFKAKRHAPKKVLKVNVATIAQEVTATTAPRLVSVRMKRNQVVEAVLDPTPTGGARIELIVGDASKAAKVRMAQQGGRFVGRLPLEVDLGLMTAFAYAEGASGGVPFRTERRWIDNDVALERVSRASVIDPNLKDLSRSRFRSADYQRILAAIQTVSAQLLSPPDSSRQNVETLRGGAPSRPVDEAIHNTIAIDPAAMIRSLRDIRRQSATSGSGGWFAGVSLSGVIAMLFAEEDEPAAIDLRHETSTASEPEKDVDAAEPSNAAPPRNEKPVSEEADALEAQMEIREQIDVFLYQISRSYFADTCEASTMVQALAFPIVLCVRGCEAGWLNKNEMTAIAARVVEIMFNQAYGPDKPHGLFALVRLRYASEGRLDEFLRRVGDGTLWAALVGSLAIDPDAALSAVIRQSAALALVFRCGELLTALSEPEQLGALVGNLVIEGAQHQIVERAQKVALAVEALTALLSSAWNTLYAEQGSGRRLQPANSILWSKNQGWLITPASPAQAYRAGYICLETAALDHRDIADLIQGVLEACRPSSRS